MKIIRIIAIILLLFIPIVNIYFVYKKCENTLIKWTSHRDILWLSEIDKIKVVYIYEQKFITLYNGEFNLFTTCIDNEKYQEYKYI